MANVKKIKIGTSEYGIATANKLTAGSKTFDGSSAVSIAAADLGAITNVTAASGNNINDVGTPAVKASTSGTTTTLTFDFLKGEQGTQGINLVLNSGVEYTNDSYPIQQYTLSEDIVLGETYTISLWGILNEQREQFQPYIGGGNSGKSFGKMKKVSDNFYKITGTIKTSSDDFNKHPNRLLIFPTPSGITPKPVSTVYKVKLEKGTVANPIWTPAPQDLIGPGIKPVESAYSGTTTTLATWGTPGRSDTWTVTSTANLVVGDVALIKLTNTDKNGTQFIFSTVTKINNSTSFTGISAGFLDKGDVGPNTVSSTTTTNLSGILKGSGSKVTTAVAGTDYLTSANLTSIENRLTALEKVRNANSIAYPV